MARLTDIPRVCKSVGILAFFRRVWDETTQDNLFIWASALAYSWLFAIFPFFIFLLALVPHLPASVQSPARSEIRRLVGDLIPSVAGSTLWKDIENNPDNMLHQKLTSRPALILGLLLALWAASGGTAMTMSALDQCYDLNSGRAIWMQRLMAIGLTIVVAALLFSTLCLVPIARMLRPYCPAGNIGHVSVADILIHAARLFVSFVLMLMVLTLIYNNGPAIRHRFILVTPGAVFVMAVWVVLGFAFRLYIDRIGAAGYNRTYGTVGGVAILLLFFYIDALVLLIGAEINSEVDFEVLRVRRGTRDFLTPEDYSSGAPTSC